MELGLYSFGDNTIDPKSGNKISPQERYKNLIEEIKLADEVGLDFFGIGEHHRKEYVVSTPVVPLAAAATVTKNIKLHSAVTVLSSDDPIRVFQQFAQLDLISSGRAEIIVGRGSFIESFPLFGYDLSDYDQLFDEKLRMLLEIRKSTNIDWKGDHTNNIDDRGVYPRSVQDPLPIWIAVGGNPQSVIRAAKLGLPLALAIIGGQPHQFKPLIDMYWQKVDEFGHDKSKLDVSINSHGYIHQDSETALEHYFHYYDYIMNMIAKERGWNGISRVQYDIETKPTGALVVGSPDEVAEKIIYEHELFNNSRFGIQVSIASMEHKDVMKAIELYGTKVAPIVKKELGDK